MDKLIQLRLLLLHKRIGKLEPHEQSELDELMLLPEAQDIKRQIDQLPDRSLVDLMEGLNIDNALANVHSQTANLRAQRKKRQIRWIAAVFIVAAGLSTYILFEGYKGSTPLASTEATTNDHAILHLANGQMIVLADTGRQQVHAGVSNQNRALTISPTIAVAKNSWSTLTVPPRLDYQINLPDGSKVWLNSETTISFLASGREIQLKTGEAYFDVAPDASRPFIVRTALGNINVLGTTFNVNAYNKAKIVTSLVSGAVSINAGIDQQTLSAGKEAIQQPGEKINVQSFDPSLVLSWKSGVHYFNDATLEDVSVMLQRWFATTLFIDDPKLKNVIIRGALNRSEPVQTFVDRMNVLGIATFYWDKQGQLHCK